VFAKRRVCEISFSYLNKMTKGQNFLGYSVEISHAIFSDENSDLAFAL